MVISFIAELLPSFIDDNLTIPIYSSVLYNFFYKYHIE